MLSEKRYVIRKVSIVFLFVFKFTFLLYACMNINNSVYPAALATTYSYTKSKRSSLFKNKLESITSKVTEYNQLAVVFSFLSKLP